MAGCVELVNPGIENGCLRGTIVSPWLENGWLHGTIVSPWLENGWVSLGKDILPMNILRVKT